ncbi:multicopper oxidase family protein [Marivibrio halodurans]|uniref:Multicopper oxidase family protein n=1 Tax=Marivibrio halodurans TaxID=2039722 RepID=A0A8J7V2L0_9PROT|nr:multicopper oxidase family protein [Marivibrio halodurans]MBP5858931.1 multicopper oxidase family protein [Marivibrio halodurans]
MDGGGIRLMGVTRRTFLRAGAAAGILAASGCRARVDARTDPGRSGPIRIEAAPAKAPLLGPAEQGTDVWAYNGTVAGPALRVKRGAELAVRLENRLTQGTSIHWHGIRIDNAMDGVVGMTQDAVAPGDGFDYRFTCPDAGTYWYHSHNRSWEQVARGLYGVLIVEEEEPPAVDREITLVLDDWRLDEAGAIHEASFGALHDWAHQGRIGNWITVNGAPPGDIAIRAGERIRLRVLNAATARIFALAIAGHEARVAAIDGFACPPSAPTDSLLFAPGQRVDYLLDATGEPGGRYALLDDAYSDARPISFLAYSDEPPKRTQFDAPPPLGETRPPTMPDPAEALRVDMVMEGGAMGGMGQAMLNGEMTGPRDLAQAGRVWAVNGVAGDLDKPLFSVPRGRGVRIAMVNDTAWPHVMHLHGHHVTLLTLDGAPSPEAGTIWRDGVLMMPRQQAEIALVADNPGKWFFHCHMLGHQAAGMRTWIEVT